MFDTLMTRLGYARYGAQGGDWGSFVTAWLGAHRREHLAGIHLNLLPLRRDAAMFEQSERRRAPLHRRARDMAQGRDRLPVDPGHAAADARVRPVRLSRRARGVDRRKVSRVDRLRRRPAQRADDGRDAGRHQPLLVHELHRRLVLAVLRAHARAVADRRPDRRADGLLRVSARDPAPAARSGATRVHRHPPLDRDAEGRALRRARAARRARARDPRVLHTDVDTDRGHDTREHREPLPRNARSAGVDTDPDETREWLDALEAVVQVAGHDRALYAAAPARGAGAAARHRRQRAALLGLPQHDSRSSRKAPIPATSRSRSA